MTDRSYNTRVAARLKIKPEQVAATIQLLDEGNTIPFIARYRKEFTLNLDEFRIRQVDETVKQMRTVDDRRDTILSSITEQDKLTPELEARLHDAETITELEDLYLPYKPKRRTRASKARERGLEPLAQIILDQPKLSAPAVKIAARYINDDVPTPEDALAGARDIVAEIIAENADIRATVRQKALTWAEIQSQRIKKSDDPKNTYRTYYDFSMRVDRVRPHQVLAMNRGEVEKILRVKLNIPERDWRQAIAAHHRQHARSEFAEQLNMAIEDCAKRLLLPAIERDIRRTLSDEAEAHAIHVFSENLRALMTQPPLNQHTVMGVDPAYRTGCKIAVITPTGQLATTTTVYPHPPQKREAEAQKKLAQLIEAHQVTLIAIGNGTASRETELLVAELTRQRETVQYVIVNEAGASVYSASDLARAEFPDLDVSLRGAVSIARRIQDPLAELVKIDPKSIGVGMYQHDVNQSRLSDALDATVESVVNQVGVDVNTASSALLQYVAGIGPKLAQNIVQYRDDNQPFASRDAVKSVSGMGAKAFQQSAGFLRIRAGDNPLDVSAIHPESYAIAGQILEQMQVNMTTPHAERAAAVKALRQQHDIDALAAKLGVGAPTLNDILDQIVRPGRDPREDVAAPMLRRDVMTMADLREGMLLQGTVRNVVDFGAFVDIGVKQDGLLHISKIPRGEMPSVGEIIRVEIIKIDPERERIGLNWAEV